MGWDALFGGNIFGGGENMCYIAVIMGRLSRRYEKVNELNPTAVPIQVYADRISRSRVYIYVRYDRYKKGFKKGDKIYYSPDPGYKIVTYHNACYVIENQDA